MENKNYISSLSSHPYIINKSIYYLPYLFQRMEWFVECFVVQNTNFINDYRITVEYSHIMEFFSSSSSFNFGNAKKRNETRIQTKENFNFFFYIRIFENLDW